MVWRLILNLLAVWIGSEIIPGIYIDSFGASLIFVIVLAVINVTLGSLAKVAGCLFNALTLGLFNFVVNVLLIIMASHLVNGISIESWVPATFLAIIMALVNSLFGELA